MRKLLPTVLVFVCVMFQGHAQETDAKPDYGATPVRFEAVEIYIDSKDEALAAYQFELSTKAGEIAIVGVEGGEHPAFKEPPYYDPAALSNDRIIIAAFNTGKDLPKGRTRVATIHLQLTGETEPEYVLELDVAASASGNRIAANISLAEGEQ
jgi:hypothetical protein